MTRHTQKQQLDNLRIQQKRAKFSFEISSVALFIVILLICLTIGTLLIILGFLGVLHFSWSTGLFTIFLTIIIPVLSAIIPLLQWLHSLSPHKSEDLHAPDLSSNTTFLPPKIFEHSHEIVKHVPSSLLSLENTISSRDSQTTTFGLRKWQEDWGEAPHIKDFYGRATDIFELKQWIVLANCRIVAVLGMGGIGKTALTAKLAEQIKDEFEYIFWRSLQNAPPPENFLKSCIQHLSNHEQIILPDDTDSLTLQLIGYLRDCRCLLILDNLESVLQAGNRAGLYRNGYEGYGRLIQAIGEANHRSCLLLTSREKPKELLRLEGMNSPVRSLLLSGLKQVEGKELLKDKELFGSDEMWAKLISFYSGNPLYLKLVSETVKEVFEGDIAYFLEKSTAVFGDISDTLNFQFTRLSEVEQSIMYWLAIACEAISLHELQEDAVIPIFDKKTLDAINSLIRRSMVEKVVKAHFSLQPVVREYVINSFVEQIVKEVQTKKMQLLMTHTLIKAQSKDYVRNSQIRLILTPIAEQLLSSLGNKECENKLKTILCLLRETQTYRPDYTAGNVLNLMVEIKTDFQGYDFSHLIVRQAYLQGVNLHNVNFTNSDLTKTVFTETFGSVLSLAFSPDGKLLATGTSSGEIWIWQTATNRLLLN